MTTTRVAGTTRALEDQTRTRLCGEVLLVILRIEGNTSSTCRSRRRQCRHGVATRWSGSDVINQLALILSKVVVRLLILHNEQVVVRLFLGVLISLIVNEGVRLWQRRHSHAGLLLLVAGVSSQVLRTQPVSTHALEDMCSHACLRWILANHQVMGSRVDCRGRHDAALGHAERRRTSFGQHEKQLGQGDAAVLLDGDVLQ